MFWGKTPSIILHSQIKKERENEMESINEKPTMLTRLK